MYGWKWSEVICARTRGHEVPEVCTISESSFQSSTNRFHFGRSSCAAQSSELEKMSCVIFCQKPPKKHSKLDEKIPWELVPNTHPYFQLLLLMSFFRVSLLNVAIFCPLSFAFMLRVGDFFAKSSDFKWKVQWIGTSQVWRLTILPKNILQN